MLSEERIKKMIRLSDYEAGMGELDLRRTRYRRRDYVRLQVLRAVAGMVAASILILGMVMLYFIDSIPWKTYVSEGFFTLDRTLWITGGVVVWLILLGILCSFTKRRSKREYDEAAARVYEYDATLDQLLRLYEDEKKEENT